MQITCFAESDWKVTKNQRPGRGDVEARPVLLGCWGICSRGALPLFLVFVYVCTAKWPFSVSTRSLRPSMSGLHLVKQGRDRKKVDVQRDFTVASPAEFVTRFGGNKVIEKVSHWPFWLQRVAFCSLLSSYDFSLSKAVHCRYQNSNVAEFESCASTCNNSVSILFCM